MLKTRIITALFLLAAFLITLFVLPEPSAAIVFAVFAALMAWEWAGLMRVDPVGRVLFAVFVVASCYY
ncbi:MAG: phosphatidate cytidylyltransferase, partial [Zoogloeaceae bacterium]|nr:phosphatidate cytidylyltransferase [Zoogloeaceae bacterium]